ncbi:MAG TPA: tRNA (adenosine(37)-N6)-threonylcarbamoyltransferase complex dimerization subunit type 1 TsaB [Acidobacteriota bacterium]|nr:tRNA (adenosine(37)-N6)-threonylcarbamoyltransferase complex dimerization subunit type 1 TsaB [Acidobacteriota bacterium]
MYLLSVDTATNSGGVALSRNSEIVGLAMLKTPLEYSDRLIDYVDFLLDNSGLGIRDVGTFVVASGPGSFTGLRVGLAAVKAFCQALDRPAVAVSTLKALAWRHRHLAERVAPMIDARRRQIYGAVYRTEDPEALEPEGAEIVGSPEEWLRSTPESGCLYVGDAAQLYSGTIRAVRPAGRILRTDNQILEALCEIGFRRMSAGKALDAAQLKANYLRPSDAEASGES